MSAGVVIVGGGCGGAHAAIALRDQGYTGTISVVCDEPDLPYDRTALSKGYLLGQLSAERILLRKPEFWANKDIHFLFSTRAVAVDAQSHELSLEDGRVLPFSKLIWSAGGAPRRLQCPGGDLPGIHYVRNRTDIDALKVDLLKVSRVAIIGGGYIGLEAASALSQLAKEVVVLEAQDRLLARVSGPFVSTFFEEEHRRHGVSVKTSAQVVEVCECRGRVGQIRISTGELIEAEAVVVGIGITPNVDALIEAGAKGGNGVEVDAHCRTTLPDVYAIGDCALHVNQYAGSALVRLESIQNATDQAGVVAKDVVGKPASYDAIPWFWSSQYDLKFQTIGVVANYNSSVSCVAPEGKSFAVIYLRDKVVVAVDCLNSPKSFVEGRKLIGKPFSREYLTAFPGGNTILV